MFDDFELSRFRGKPIHLFVFSRQNLTWRLASADRDVVVGAHTYLGAQIERSEIKQTAERAKDKITIRMAYLRDPAALEYPVTQALGDNWHPFIPSDSVHVVCLSTHHGDSSPPIVEWSGVVTQPKFGDVTLELTCEPTNGLARARQQGPKWQRACWKTVYSAGPRGCNLSRDSVKVEGMLSSATGMLVSSPAFGLSPLPLAGGYLTWTRSDGLVERRTIMGHSGNTITLLYGAADLAAGLAVVALPGCARTWAACEVRGNTDNYGGSVYKPIKNPMDGVSMSW
ncbi:phage BR0599 family protein [Stenotrophomonas forensis]|uniref:phage BR0599 family protein n=1 Tax=Stenotrophomonas forensis TaxID=2871169 RepID=UPI0018D3B107|nr:DUF2163 domain-containing protein [Stenotrophomonas maltophilia]MBH1501868.1 DUF2163 domain-containing protein [Stenotrophomonas maltophilia]MBH1785061.1 DUF2163 domain-containing protein [Stenotrophomonas maltophilia]